MNARRFLVCLLAWSLTTPLAGQTAEPETSLPAAGKVELHVPGHAVLGQQQSVTVHEALVVPTLSVFAGKSGVVRLRGGVLAPILVLSSRDLGCGAVQRGLPPAVGITKKAAAAMEARLETTRPRSQFAPVEFVPRTESDFTFQLTGRQELEVGEIRAIEQDKAARPTSFESLFGEPQLAAERQAFRMTENSVWTPLLGGYTFRSTRSGFTLWREGDQIWADIDVKEAALTVRGKVLLQPCPPLIHLHIEPK